MRRSKPISASCLNRSVPPEVTIAWQSGEPTLMGLDFFKRAMDYVKQYTRPGVTVQHTMQTNGILLNEAWCDFFREHHFLIGLSLDDPQAMHDTYRVDKGGARPSTKCCVPRDSCKRTRWSSTS